MTRAELKIGDWVSFEGKPFQIYDLTRYGDVVWYDEGASSVLMEEIEPIKLTEEILEKNGWQKHLRQSNLYENDYMGIVIQKDGTFDFFYLDTCIHTISYVHQLQHLLWALGMDDNLKL